MMLYSFPALATSFPRTFIIKGNANHGNIHMTTFQDITFIKEEATGCISEEVIDTINEVAIVYTIGGRNLPSCIFILCFTISVAPSIDRQESSSNFKILLISFKPSFEINEVNPFPALIDPCPLVALSIYL